MFELTQAAANTYYIECPAKIGVWRANGTDVYLIDSGNDRDAGRKVRQILDEHGWTLKGILNTHSNADHIGGNNYLQGKSGCPVFANGAEAALTRHPSLESALLYGGFPFADCSAQEGFYQQAFFENPHGKDRVPRRAERGSCFSCLRYVFLCDRSEYYC